MSPDDPRHGTSAGYAAHWGSDRNPCEPCRRAHSRIHKGRKYARFIGKPTTVPAAGTRRRIQALVALGYLYDDIAPELGVSPQAIKNMVSRDRSFALRSTAEKVAALYDAWSMTAPDESTTATRRRARLARTIARKHGWAPPLAWDDIDTDDQPTDMRRPADRLRDSAAEVVEEFDWLVSLGESEEQAASRLGVQPETVRVYRIRLAKRTAA